MPEPTQAEAVAWSRSTFGRLAEGGTWTVPRSGLVFQRKGDELVLISKVPLMPGMEVTSEAERDEDYETIRQVFGLAGVTVRQA